MMYIIHAYYIMFLIEMVYLGQIIRVQGYKTASENSVEDEKCPRPGIETGFSPLRGNALPIGHFLF